MPARARHPGDRDRPGCGGDPLAGIDEDEVPVGPSDLLHEAPFEADADEKPGLCPGQPGHLFRRRLVGVRRLALADENLDGNPVPSDPLEKIGLGEDAHEHGDPGLLRLSPGRQPRGRDENRDQDR